MKSIISKIASILMALLVLVSTLSLNVEKHFCGDFLVDVSYFGNSNGCAGEIEGDSCDTKETIKKKNCCKDEIEKIEGQDDLQKENLDKITLKKQQLAFAFVSTYYNLFKIFPNQIVPHEEYLPPNIITDIQVLHEVFII